jgi:cytochrome c peroxidase
MAGMAHWNAAEIQSNQSGAHRSGAICESIGGAPEARNCARPAGCASEVHMFRRLCVFVLLSSIAAACGTPEVELAAAADELSLPSGLWIANPLGAAATVSSAGAVDLDNPFFSQALGTNGRACAHCHSIASGWSVSAAEVRLRFALTRGLDPIFRTNDGSNSPAADVSTVEARRAAYSMLLARGTIRVGLPAPASAELELVAIDDPYGFASPGELSLFRRPLPSTNLDFSTLLMWDGRVVGGSHDEALVNQADGATRGHAAAPLSPPADVLAAIVDFESNLFSAQVFLFDGGRLDRGGALGGAAALLTQPIVGGGGSATRWTLFDAWASAAAGSRRAAIARGQALFNTARDTAGGTCAGCHDVVNVGTRLDGRFFNVRVSAPARRSADQPLYTFRNLATGELRATTDPGRALITGKWSDMDRFKVPALRSLASRAPYFHDGSARTLEDVVRHYEANLGFVFSDAQRADLTAFLSAL